MNYHYHPDAQKEASATLAYYTAIDQQLGVRFLAELENTIARIVNMPEALGPHTLLPLDDALCIDSLTALSTKPNPKLFT